MRSNRDLSFSFRLRSLPSSVFGLYLLLLVVVKRVIRKSDNGHAFAPSLVANDGNSEVSDSSATMMIVASLLFFVLTASQQRECRERSERFDQ